jgi:creatinine amidohydrolase
MEPILETTTLPAESRLARLSSPAAEARLHAASIAYVPLGSLEYHGPHLPLGVDMITAEGVCLAAADRSGGVVLPPIYLANGCLDLPHTLDFDPALVEAWTRAVVAQLRRRGVRVVVLLTGHGPLDLIHLLKRVARDTSLPDFPVYGLCWLELNAARLTEPQTGEPTVIDHASTIETSWMLALAPDLVDLEQLPPDPTTPTLGVYGANPRFTASPRIGREQVDACADLLASRAAALESGEWQDSGQDLQTFVDLVWPEPLVLEATRDDARGVRASVTNPGRASRYLSAVTSVSIGGHAVPSDEVILANTSPGENGRPVAAADLTPESGLYVRRGQRLEVRLPATVRDLGSLGDLGDVVTVDLELGGVRAVTLTAELVPGIGHDSESDLDGPGNAL